MQSYKYVEIIDIDQWCGPSDQQNGSDSFRSLLVPFIEELDCTGLEDLMLNAEFCKWDWKQWEMRYVYQNIGNVDQKIICDVGGYLNPLIRLFAMKGAMCHIYDQIKPDTSLFEPLSYNSIIQYEQKDVCSLDCPDDTFDAVFSISTLEHVVNKRLALSEIIRVTKPGGLFICTFDVCSHDLDYQLEDSFFTDFPLNERAVEDLLALSANSIKLPDKHQCWEFWEKDPVYMSIHDRWPNWEFLTKRDFTSLGCALRVKSSPTIKGKKEDDFGPVVDFTSVHSARNHLVWGFYNSDPNGGRFTRKTARLRLNYNSESHNYFFLKGFYPCLSRTPNRLYITIGGFTILTVPLVEDQILDLCIAIPTELTSGTIFVDLEVDNIANVDNALLGFLVHKCGLTQSRIQN